MAKKTITTPTKTIAFRMKTGIVNAITKAAKEKGISVQEFFLSQINLESELGHILRSEQERMLEESQNISNVRDRMAKEALQIRESLGISEEAFEAGIVQAFRLLVGSNKAEPKQPE